ncbi:hypothetical protein BDR26DRAFT_959763 [Obelidium mucronatum]|nr:hypothetical protein BDR26DRAFT_959763 [Obelidium mucronatum]
MREILSLANMRPCRTAASAAAAVAEANNTAMAVRINRGLVFNELDASREECRELKEKLQEALERERDQEEFEELGAREILKLKSDFLDLEIHHSAILKLGAATQKAQEEKMEAQSQQETLELLNQVADLKNQLELLSVSCLPLVESVTAETQVSEVDFAMLSSIDLDTGSPNFILSSPAATSQPGAVPAVAVTMGPTISTISTPALTPAAYEAVLDVETPFVSTVFAITTPMLSSGSVQVQDVAPIVSESVAILTPAPAPVEVFLTAELLEDHIDSTHVVVVAVTASDVEAVVPPLCLPVQTASAACLEVSVTDRVCQLEESNAAATPASGGDAAAAVPSWNEHTPAYNMLDLAARSGQGDDAMNVDLRA